MDCELLLLHLIISYNTRIKPLIKTKKAQIPNWLKENNVYSV